MGQQPAPESEQQHEDIKMNLLLTDNPAQGSFTKWAGKDHAHRYLTMNKKGEGVILWVFLD